MIKRTSDGRLFGAREAKGCRVVKHDATCQSSAPNGCRPGRCQQRICADVVLTGVNVFLEVMENVEYFVSRGHGMEHRVLQGGRMAAYDTMNALEAAWICNVIAEQPRGTSARRHY